MPKPTLPMEGGCRCGQVRFRVTAPPLVTMACHCTGCQKMTGGPYSVSVAVPALAFEVTAGEPVFGGMRGETRHMHCPHCLSWVFTEPGFGMVNVRATMLDDTSWFTPFMETCTREKLSWVTTPAKYSFEGFPEPAEWPRLMTEYGADR